MPFVTFTLYPPEFRWGDVPAEFDGDLWILRGIAAADSMSYNTTTLRYLSMGSPLDQQGTANAAGATFRAPKPFVIASLAMLFDTAFGVGESATFQFNVNGTTRAEIICSLVAGEQKKLATGTIEIARGDFVCLECTANAAGPDIQSMSFKIRTAPGDNPSV